MDETLKLLAQQIGEEEQRITEDLAMGRAEEHAQYMHACGIVRGFQITQSLIASMVRNMEEDDE
jgi:hypothetical protein|tara:strand:+ start:320 stop:511 length:192 start_codon:yes stop_codon:yes gene_type:complete